MAGASKPYTMKISRLTVDKLGVKLYDRVSAVLAELVANAYDADAKCVTITAPAGVFLAQKKSGIASDLGFKIVVADDGHGMTPTEVNDFYLLVGAERRRDPKRGDVSRQLKRKVMGRKGVGKLAPFGVCQRLEIVSAGGDLLTEGGRQGYRVAHLALDRDSILSNTDEDYHPTPGEFDGSLRETAGTTLTLSGFDYRKVPEVEDLSRQLSQRFGALSSDWAVRIINSMVDPSDAAAESVVGVFSVPLIDSTRIELDGSDSPITNPAPSTGGVELRSGFRVDGRFYKVTGFVGYAKHAFKDDLMAGVRIYCRGKIAAQTAVFNRSSGFTGEFGIRSYLVGELHCDWLDEDEDMIQTDRRDILWSTEVGTAFEAWGQQLVARVGQLARDPMKRRAWDVFAEKTKVEERIEKVFPGATNKQIRANALELAKIFGQRLREDELADATQLEDLAELCLTFAPHIALDQTLRLAAEAGDSSLGAVSGILRTARVAELTSFGRIASERVRVIARLEDLKDKKETLESELQDLIEQAHWLIDPKWSPVTSNQSFKTLRLELEKYVMARTGTELSLTPFPQESKRADFVLQNHGGRLEVVEIKRPKHTLTNDEMDRLNAYISMIEDFLADPANKEFRAEFSELHTTLVCDDIGLAGVHKTAFEALIDKGRLEHISWSSFFLRTRKAHQDFLDEADRQRALKPSAP